MAITLSGDGITSAMIAADGIDGSKIADDAVSTDHLANSINTEIAANTAKTGITSGQATAITAALPKAGGTLTGTLNITQASTADTIKLTRTATSQNNMIKFVSGGSDKWIVGQRNDSTDHFRFYSYGTSSDVLSIQTDGKVGIGITTPDSLLHIRNGDAGGVSATSDSVLTLEGSSSVGLQFLSPNTTVQSIYFGDTQDNAHGIIRYDHANTRLTMGSDGGATTLIIDAGNATFSGGVTATSFSGAGTIDTVATTDPLVTTNPSAVGHIWFNKTTGDIFTCTRNVANENVWINSTDSGRHVRFKKSNGTADLFGDGSDKLHLTFNEALASTGFIRDYSDNFTCTADANVDFTKDSMFSTYAAKFNGNGEIQVPFMSNTFRRTDAFTISLWITRKGDIPDGSLPFSFNGNSSTNGRGVRVTGNNISRVSTTSSNTMSGALPSSFTVNDGDHFVVIGHSNATSTLYKNGSSVGTTPAATAGHSNVSNSAGGSIGGFGNVYNPTGYDGHSYFNCTVNNFRVFNKAVSSTEVATLYAEGY